MSSDYIIVEVRVDDPEAIQRIQKTIQFVLISTLEIHLMSSNRVNQTLEA